MDIACNLLVMLIAHAGAAPTAPMFRPDVRVNHLGTSSDGPHTLYRFRVQNIGIGTATDVGLDTRIYQQSLPVFPFTENLTALQNGSGGTIASLDQDQAQEVTISCTPLPGYYCTATART